MIKPCEMSGVLCANDSQDNFTTIYVPGSATSFEEFATNLTFATSVCSSQDAAPSKASLDLFTTFSLSRVRFRKGS